MVNLFITAIVTLVMSHILPGIMVESFMSALFFALVFGITNAIIGKIIKGIGCLLNLLSLGLFNLVVNGLMVLLASKFIDGVQVDGIITAIILSFVISIFTTSETERDRQSNK